MKTPIFGPFSVTRSTNLADNRLVNLYPEVVESRQGKEVGALFLCPGLDLLGTIGVGPIRGTHPMGDQLFVVSGSELYSVNAAFQGTLIAGPGVHVASGATVSLAQSGAGSYAPKDVVTATGGTGTEPSFTVTDTQVFGTPTVVAAGSGGTDGPITLSGVTGTGTVFQCTGNVVGGALINPLTLTDPGDYTVNPTDLSAEPVVDETHGTLTGATVALKMGMLTLAPKTYGSLTALPAFPQDPVAVTTTGSGTGGTILVSYAAGTIATGAVSMIDNGKQIAIFAGQNGYVWSKDAGFGIIVLPFDTAAGAISASYMDGFGVINQPGTGFIFQSDLLDLSSWKALNFGDASGDSDNLVVIAQIRREFWLIKQYETEIWYDAGTKGFAFAVLAGPYPEVGCAAQQSVALCGDALCWLAQNRSGESFVVMSRGHEAVRISTHALESVLAEYGGISDAVGYGYIQDGHQFYVLNFPSADATWAYDLTESALAREPMWHQRASFSGGVLHRHPANNHSFFAGKNVVGDALAAALYAFNLDTLTDAGAQRKWLRSWRALSQPSEVPVRFSELRLDMQTGIGIAEDANPQIVLRWSDDGGNTWSNEVFGAVGKSGETAKRIIFRRLGATRRNSGLDRIFEVSSTDQFPAVIIGADLR